MKIEDCLLFVVIIRLGDSKLRHIYFVKLGQYVLAGCGAISMGQGQEVHARKLVAQSLQDGSWVLLHNCHLGLDYIDELLDTILTADYIQDSFRVWITTDVHPKFPINFLQVSHFCHVDKCLSCRHLAEVLKFQQFLKCNCLHYLVPLLSTKSDIKCRLKELQDYLTL